MRLLANSCIKEVDRIAVSMKIAVDNSRCNIAAKRKRLKTVNEMKAVDTTESFLFHPVERNSTSGNIPYM